MTLRSKVIRLAHQKPELREHLLPLLGEGKTARGPTRGYSDDYFLGEVRPLITKRALNQVLRPLGFEARGKGSLDRKNNQIEMYIDDIERGRARFRVVLAGSYMTSNDGVYNVYVEDLHHRPLHHDWHEPFSGDPKKDAATMMKDLGELIEDLVRM